MKKKKPHLHDASPACTLCAIPCPLLPQVIEYNAALKRLLAAHPGVTLVDLYAACEARLRQLRDGGAALVPPPPSYAGWQGVAWHGSGATLWHWLFGVSWDTIGASLGLHLLCDFLHLNDKGGQLVVEVLEPWLEDLVSSHSASGGGSGGGVGGGSSRAASR
jgi:hypothetical protein